MKYQVLAAALKSSGQSSLHGSLPTKVTAKGSLFGKYRYLFNNGGRKVSSDEVSRTYPIPNTVQNARNHDWRLAVDFFQAAAG